MTEPPEAAAERVRHPNPTVPTIVVIGVSGSGKSTLAARLAGHWGREFVEGDEFHPPANVAKMSAGTPLTDDDRVPWLRTLAGVIAERVGHGIPLVVSCSALRRRYRDILRAGDPTLVFLHVHGTASVLRQRIQARRDHFMPPHLLDSQLATLEPLSSDEPGATVSVEGTTEEVFERALAVLADLCPPTHPHVGAVRTD